MRKYAAIFFLVIYLVSTPQLLELLKVPVMAEHYTVHKKENSNMGILEFLCLHYFHGNVKDADYDEDMKLPFKSMCNTTTSFIAILYPQDIIEVNIQKEYFEFVHLNSLYHPSDYSSNFLSTIWQPPKA